MIAALGAAGMLLATGNTAFADTPLSPNDLKQVDAIVGSRKLILFGEDAHRLPSIQRAVAQMFRHLVETKHVRLLVFESAWGVEDVLTDFMASDRTTFSGREPFFLNAFASSETAGLLVWIRDWNRAHPKDRVLISGFQPEQPVTDYAALKAGAADRADLVNAIGTACGFDTSATSDIDYIVALSKGGVGAPLQTGEARTACAAAINKLGKVLPLPKTTSTRELALHLYSLRYYVGSVAAEFDEKPSPTLIERSAALGRAYDAVDTARLHIFDELTQTRYAGLKVFFWMHNWHAARRASEIDTLNTLGFGIPTGTISFGERLGGREGRGVAVLGSVVPCPATGGCTEPADGVEAALKARYGDEAAVVALTGTRGIAFTTPTTLLSNSNKMALRSVVLARQFDGLLYLPTEQ